MEDMIIHENIFDISKALSNSGEQTLSDHLYEVLQIVLSPQYTYSQKTKKLKGKFISISFREAEDSGQNGRLGRKNI